MATVDMMPSDRISRNSRGGSGFRAAGEPAVEPWRRTRQISVSGSSPSAASASCGPTPASQAVTFTRAWIGPPEVAFVVQRAGMSADATATPVVGITYVPRPAAGQ